MDEKLINKSNPWEKYTYPELKNIVASMKINNKPLPFLLRNTMLKKKDMYKKEKSSSKYSYWNVDTKLTNMGKNHGR